MSDSNTQMLLLILVIGGVAAMTMGSKGENNYQIQPKINLGSIPEFDADQNMEDIENKKDKTVEDVVNLVKKKEDQVKKFKFDDYDRNVAIRVKWLLYEASTMYDMLNYLEFYMNKNSFRGVDDLRAAGEWEAPIVALFENLVALCKKRQSEFYNVWTQLNSYGQFGWLAANQWLVNTPNDILNRLRQFDSSEVAFKAAMEIANGKTMADVNAKLMDVYKTIQKIPSPQRFKDIDEKLKGVLENQTAMMQVDNENAGKFAIQVNDGSTQQLANVKRTTHQARAPSEDPFGGKPGTQRLTALWVDENGKAQKMEIDYDPMDPYPLTNPEPYARSGALPSNQGNVTQNVLGDLHGSDIPIMQPTVPRPAQRPVQDHRMAPGETVSYPPLRPRTDFDQANATGQFGSAYAGIDPKARPIDQDTKREAFGVKEGGGLFGNAMADFPDQRETYQNSAPEYGPADDMDSTAPSTASHVPASIDDGFLKARANKVKLPIPNTAYTKEVQGKKRAPDVDYSPVESKRLKEDNEKPAPTQQQLDESDADPYMATQVNQYDIVGDHAPRDEMAQKNNVESWVGKNENRTIKELSPVPETDMDGDDMFASAPAAATDLGIGMTRAELSVPASALMTNPYAAVQTNPTKQTHLVNKSGSSGPTYRSRSVSMDQRAQAIEYLASPKKKFQTQLDRSPATVTMMDAVDQTAAELR